MQGFTGKVRDFVHRAFPERQLLHRSRGQVRFLTLGTPVQLVLVILLMSVTGWIAFATGAWLHRGNALADRERRLSQINHDYGALSSLMSTHQDQVLSIARELESNNRQILGLIEQKAQLEQRLASLTDDAETLRIARESAEQSRLTTHRRLSQVEGALNGAAERAAALESRLSTATAELAAVTAERDNAVDQGRQLGQKLAALESAVKGMAGDRDRGTKALADAKTRLDQAATERDHAVKSSRELSDRVVTLERRLAEMRDLQRHLIARVEGGARDTVDDIEQIIARTGLTAERLLRAANPGQGGPFVGLGPGETVAGQAQKVEIALGRWTELQNLLISLPLTAPVDDYFVESGFGRRVDPFTRRPAFHQGLDLSAASNRGNRPDILAPAPGMVVFAGFSGPYGRMVEIDHGNGIVSRFAHLSRINVRVGKYVERRDNLGQMGSSGRSTGTHLHYEILYQGNPLDPAKFLEAGRHVFKN